MSIASRFDYSSTYGMVSAVHGDYVYTDEYQEVVSENEKLCREIEALKQSIPKVRADAIRDAKDAAVFSYEEQSGAFGDGIDTAIYAYDTHLGYYANKIEAD
jgi:hypothetical protein